MTSIPTIAAIRFGYGLAPGQPAPQGAADLLAQLARPDAIAARLPVTPFDRIIAEARENSAMKRKAKKGDKAVEAAFRDKRRAVLIQSYADMRTMIARAALSPDGFRERLVQFWTDHFTAAGKMPIMRGTVPGYVEAAIRPHLAGRFAELLRAVETHPMMLHFLDQTDSTGPNSAAARRKGAGLNENLAREILELHTLGVHGSYTQADVRQLAELLTGVSFRMDEGFVFRPNMAEPGAETVLGKSYGGRAASLDDVYAALDDLAVHPDTARHLARKLAVHFVADDPDPALVAHVEAAWNASRGDLTAVYAALLEHPSAWAPLGAKAKRPFDFIASSLRALDLPEAALLELPGRAAYRLLLAPMRAMGQTIEAPPGPQGWPEAAEAWISPPTLAARIQWAMTTPRVLLTDRLPDPRDLVAAALADAAGPELVLAAARSENRAEGVGLVLASPDFNRR
jgi:uncharacterized protein (DUF1800 family)